MENNSQAIELKGIARSLTKLGVQDGQCEDIVNLRLKDGSWRVSDDGKLVHTLPNNYTQLYVHTNVYHHLLGVLNGKLWYFADIDNDGETFTPLDTPMEICEVQGEVTIVQNGHLLTIISAAGPVTTPLPLKGDEKEIKYAMFMSGYSIYKRLVVEENGLVTDRTLYPLGRVHLNLDCDAKVFTKENKDAGKIYCDGTDINYRESGVLIPKDDESSTHAAAKIWHADMLDVFRQARDENYFTQPFLAIVAVQLYDGSYLYAENPIYLHPREKYNSYEYVYNKDKKNDESIDTSINPYYQYKSCLIDYDNTTINKIYVKYEDCFWNNNISDQNHHVAERKPIYYSGASGHFNNPTSYFEWLTSKVFASSLVITLEDINAILSNPDIFQGISIFVTKESDLYYLGAEDYKKGVVYTNSYSLHKMEGIYCVTGNAAYKPGIRSKDEVIYDLINSPFFLLRSYSLNELETMKNSSTLIDLSKPEYKGLLNGIADSKDIIKSETLNRVGFVPKVAYSYNQRLHIANYKSELFHGYPIDYFQLSNHNVKIEQGSYAVGGVLPNLKDGADFQYRRSAFYFADCTGSHHSEDEVDNYIISARKYGTCFASISVDIETQNGESRVVRYIAPYNSNATNTAGSLLDEEPFKKGDNANFFEYLSPLLTYPDIRAKQMNVRLIKLYENAVTVYEQAFALSAHPYLNIAYYIDPELKPILPQRKRELRLKDFLVGTGIDKDFLPYTEQNATESYPNGLKVSNVNNPFYFPNATTYQVGSAEIVALMSNAVAVGTGQTGSAPLYVFCKDGIYALLVDSSGELAYTNARIIARDVCNNANSVTPIDSGVVFTTDRGLMSIAGSEVVELGQIAEGDVFDITDTSDKAKKIMFNSFTMYQLGALPQDLLDNVDFLTFLKGSIVNYNHNERELMVSNPNYKYTYVMDRNGNWSRRNYRADEYVNNYPTSYRVQHVSDQYGERSYLYKVDTESTSLGNQMYLLSQVIKLGTIAFKQAYRLVVRGYFESIYASTIGCYVFGSYDGRQWALLGRNEKSGKFTDIGCKIAHTDVKFLRLCLAGKLSKESRIDFVEVAADGSILNTKVR